MQKLSSFKFHHDLVPEEVLNLNIEYNLVY